MTDFALFLGCGIPSNENNYELATRRVLEKVGVNLNYMPGAGCCGHDLEPIDRQTFLAWAARNLCIAESMGMDLLVLCPSCYLTLKSVNDCLRQDERQRQATNEMLGAVGLAFQGTARVIHYVDLLLEDQTLSLLRDRFVRPLQDLHIGVHYGCHLLRPSKTLAFDHPFNPTKIDRLVEATGAKSIPYQDKTMCCGSSILGTDMRTSLSLAGLKLSNIKEAGLQAMVTVCPVCHLMYDGNQALINKTLKQDHDVPVLHLTQLLGLASGYGFEEVGLHKNKAAPERLRALVG